MIVVADTTPINYLILIDQIHLLHTLFDRTFIPTSVHGELLRPAAPSPVRTWASTPPAWLEIRSPSVTQLVTAKLDEGERDAIALALELHAPRIIIDESKGRKAAKSHGLSIIGTLGILEQANLLGLVDLPTAISRLRSTSFYIDPARLDALLKQRQ